MRSLINIALAIAFVLMLIAGLVGIFPLTLYFYFIAFIVFTIANILLED